MHQRAVDFDLEVPSDTGILDLREADLLLNYCIIMTIMLHFIYIYINYDSCNKGVSRTTVLARQLGLNQSNSSFAVLAVASASAVLDLLSFSLRWLPN